MKIVRFYGGLGNQMFQYAMLVALRETQHEEALMDTSLYSSYNLHNGFELASVFNIHAGTASKEQIKRLGLYTENYRLARLYHYALPARKTEFKEKIYGKYYPEALTKAGDVCYNGYWQHWQYFDKYRDVLLKEFSLRNELDARNSQLVQELKSSSCVSVHVRRGDYLGIRRYRGLCQADYYRQAIVKAKEIAGQDAHFYFFSDDMTWCKENLSDLIDAQHFHSVDWNRGNESYKDLILMSSCRVNIIANSSFSWWSAYLNCREDKAIIAPGKWINLSVPDRIQMPSWWLI